jgi:hypothetical protein
MPQVNHVGYEGIVQVAGVDVNATSFDVTETIDTVEVTNTSDYDAVRLAGFKRDVPTLRRAAVNLEYWWDSNNDQFPVVKNGAIITLKLYRQRDGTRNWNFPKFLVNSYKEETGGPGGVIKCSLSGFSNGGYDVT